MKPQDFLGIYPCPFGNLTSNGAQEAASSGYWCPWKRRRWMESNPPILIWLGGAEVRRAKRWNVYGNGWQKYGKIIWGEKPEYGKRVEKGDENVRKDGGKTAAKIRKEPKIWGCVGLGRASDFLFGTEKRRQKYGKIWEAFWKDWGFWAIWLGDLGGAAGLYGKTMAIWWKRYGKLAVKLRKDWLWFRINGDSQVYEMWISKSGVAASG